MLGSYLYLKTSPPDLISLKQFIVPLRTPTLKRLIHLHGVSMVLFSLFLS